jgi:hypothetical protein
LLRERFILHEAYRRRSSESAFIQAAFASNARLTDESFADIKQDITEYITSELFPWVGNAPQARSQNRTAPDWSDPEFVEAFYHRSVERARAARAARKLRED